jgi:hypothetical protein
MLILLVAEHPVIAPSHSKAPTSLDRDSLYPPTTCSPSTLTLLGITGLIALSLVITLF